MAYKHFIFGVNCVPCFRENNAKKKVVFLCSASIAFCSPILQRFYFYDDSTLQRHYSNDSASIALFPLPLTEQAEKMNEEYHYSLF